MKMKTMAAGADVLKLFSSVVEVPENKLEWLPLVRFFKLV